MYIVPCISKAQKGINKLLRKAVIEAKEGNVNIKQQVCDIGNKFFKFCLNQYTRSSEHSLANSNAKSVTKCDIRQYIFPC